jgi:uncharacterized protein YcbX
MTSAGTVVGLARYPVKSFQGESVDHADIGAKGMDGDRRWALVDQATGKALSAKREPRLLQAEARFSADGTVAVTLPDGTKGAPGDPALDHAVQAWLDRDVRFERAADDNPRAYEMNVSSEDDASPLVDIGCPPGTFMDFGAVHVLTTASLRAAKALYPEGDWRPPRFRPTILVEADGAEFAEDAWVGQAVRIGAVVLQPFMPTVRCVMTTRAQSQHGLDRDLGIAKTVNQEHGGSLGVYCVVAEPGAVSMGDTLTVG